MAFTRARARPHFRLLQLTRSFLLRRRAPILPTAFITFIVSVNVLTFLLPTHRRTPRSNPNDNGFARHIAQNNATFEPTVSWCRDVPPGERICNWHGLFCMNGSHLHVFDDVNKYNNDAYHQKYKQNGFHERLVSNIEPSYASLHEQYSGAMAYASTRGTFFSNAMEDHQPLNVTWVPSMALVDFPDGADEQVSRRLMWVLDAVLFERSLSMPRENKRRYASAFPRSSLISQIDGEKTWIVMTRRHMQLLKDSIEVSEVTRLLSAIFLMRDNIYTTFSTAHKTTSISSTLTFPELYNAATTTTANIIPSNATFPLITATSSSSNLICSGSLTTGVQDGYALAERVCTHVRARIHSMFGISEPPMRKLGLVRIAQPNARILLIADGISNADAVNASLHRHAEVGNFLKGPTRTDMRMVSGVSAWGAQQWALTLSEYGVVIARHAVMRGDLQLLMHRFAALIDVVPVGWTDDSGRRLAATCSLVKYYEVKAQIAGQEDTVKGMCSENEWSHESARASAHIRAAGFRADPCVAMKNADRVTVDAKRLIGTITDALEHLGHDTDTWLNY